MIKLDDIPPSWFDVIRIDGLDTKDVASTKFTKAVALRQSSLVPICVLVVPRICGKID